jgi:protoporphyrinogen oxidase
MERHVIIGAGPAGLTIARELTRLGRRNVLLLEADPRYVGGIARTVEYKGNRFDMGGHRFYTKSDTIDRMWKEMLPDDFIQVPRLSRIYYAQRFFPYPIEVFPTLRELGLVRSFRIGMSYLRARLFPRRPELSFEDWITNRFGQELYRTFFKTYTEKIWGIRCDKISKDWAAQRIRGLSLMGALKNALFPPKGNSDIKTLIKTFTYPRFGPGQLWEAVRDEVLAAGAELRMNTRVVRIRHQGGVVTAVETDDGATHEASHFYTTMPLGDLVTAMEPPPPPEVALAGRSLLYRDFVTVALVVDRESVFPDNWIYIHDPGVLVGRIQNYKNWSPYMMADPSRTCLGMEYFCQEGDAFWSRQDADLIALAAQELETIGLAKASDCVDGCVVRLRKTYPVYDEDYKKHRDVLKEWLQVTFRNLYPAGRGALHNYNSQDHSMMMAILSVRNMEGGVAHDIWSINTDEEYAEEGGAQSDLERRLVPRPLDSGSKP